VRRLYLHNKLKKQEMKYLITAVFAFLALTFAAQAQQTGKRSHRQHRKAHIVKQLNLTDAQKAQAKQYRAEMKAQRLALEKNDGLTVKEYRARQQVLKAEYKTKMQGLLTTEQKNKLATLKQQKAEQRQQRHNNRLMLLKSKMNLSDGQMAKIKSGREARQKELLQLKQDNSLGHLEKKGKIKELRKKNKEALMALLTPEQKTTLEELKKNRQHKKMAK
jgi:periplasmic protein CpxP/Spy